MLDINYIRRSPEEVKERLSARGLEYASLVDEILSLDEKQRALKAKLDELRHKKNEVSKEIGRLIAQGAKAEAEQKKVTIADLDSAINSTEEDYDFLERKRDELISSLPNIPDPDVPIGGEEEKRIVKEWGEKPAFHFKPKDHVELATRLQLIDFPAAARVTGSGFQFFIGNGALLQRSLINLMLDVHISRHGYIEVRPPFVTKEDAPFGTGQLPKFSHEMYHVFIPLKEAGYGLTIKPHYYLIPTAEVPVCNIYREQILEGVEFPLKFVAYSPCFRVEAGHYGKEARGLMRVHQFEKVELVNICKPEQSDECLERMTEEAEHILELLGLPYRRVLLPSGDMGFAASKTYDLEVYAAGMDDWLEVSSASNTRDFQARRMNTRFRREPGAKPEFVHLLNASGLALPRLMIALLENNQLENGNVRIPEILSTKYLGGMKYLTPPKSPLPWFD